jgi:hypothetical protein
VRLQHAHGGCEGEPTSGAQRLIHCQHCRDYIRILNDAASQYGDAASLLVRVADQKQADFSEALLLAKQALSELQSARCEFESHRQQQHQDVVRLTWVHDHGLLMLRSALDR